MTFQVKKAVFPVAGLGTRFLPATKTVPKEMLPVVDKPLIQYAVEEALAAGARRLVFITGASKRAIEDHFDSDQELEGLLRRQGKSELLRQLRSVLPSCRRRRTKKPVWNSTSTRRSSFSKFCSRKCKSRCCEKHRPVSRQPQRTCSKNWRNRISCRS